MLALPSSPLSVGIDEAGIGPWAGPVMAGAVIIHPEAWSKICRLPINDSKKLSRRQRSAIVAELSDVMADASLDGLFDMAWGEASVDEIFTLTIRQATYLAMTRAVEKLKCLPTDAIVDGNHAPKLAIRTSWLVKGDQQLATIAAASIVAKVRRDKIMEELHEMYPQYGWSKNAGYGTKEHQQAMLKYGLTPHHRRGYAPVKALLTPARPGGGDAYTQ